MGTVLITGASGFIGGHLAEVLARRGDRVRCLVRRTSSVQPLESLDLELVYGDIRQPACLQQALEGVDVVYHLAAMTCALRPSEMMRVNGEAVGHLARACADQRKPPVHVLVSSIAAAGPVARGQVRTEADPPAPISHYGRSKRAGEIAAQQWADRVPTTIVRPGIVFGQRNREMLPVFRTIRRFRIHPIAGIHSPPLTMIHVEDLVEILVRAAEHGLRIAPAGQDDSTPERGYYFAGAPEYPDYAELGRMLRSLVGRPRALMVHFPGPFPWMMAGTNQLLSRLRGRPDMFNLDKIREAKVASWACSPQAVQRDLDFVAPQPLVERLQQTAQWYQEQGWL